MLLFWILTFAVFFVDQMMKFYIKNNVVEFFKVDTIIPFLKITHIKNFGAALGILSNNRWFIAIITLAFIIYLLYLVVIKGIKNKLFLLSAAFIVGGGVSNLFDRILQGYVVDYLSVSFFPPVCNLADYFISAGVILLCIYIFKSEKNK